MQPPSVENVGSGRVTVKFFAWRGSSDAFVVQGYKIVYVSDGQGWTTYSIVEAIDGQDFYTVSVTGLKVFQVLY